jgi:hypothetical protein
VRAMPSLRHELLAEVFRSRPAFAAEVLAEQWKLALPGYGQVRLASGQITDLAPTEYQADAVVTFHAVDDPQRAVLAVVVEAQLSKDRDKRKSWPVYATALHRRWDCPTVLLVVSPDPDVAAWSAAPIDLGFGLITVQALVLGPDLVPVVTDADTAGQHPEQAVLSVIAHTTHPEHDQVVQAMVDGFDKIDRALAGRYTEVVLAVLPEAARVHLEKLMTTRTYEYLSDFARRYVDQGRTEGRTEGRTQAGRRRRRFRGCQEGRAQAPPPSGDRLPGRPPRPHRQDAAAAQAAAPPGRTTTPPAARGSEGQGAEAARGAAGDQGELRRHGARGRGDPRPLGSGGDQGFDEGG